MNYQDCEDFIKNRMRMSHVYQPVMLMTLLQKDVHLIPRRPGDVENPVGGIRNVIPGKASY